MAANFGPFEEICFTDFRAFEAVVLAAFVASAPPTLYAKAPLPKTPFAVWASLISAVTTTAESVAEPLGRGGEGAGL